MNYFGLKKIERKLGKLYRCMSRIEKMLAEYIEDKNEKSNELSRYFNQIKESRNEVVE